MKNLALKLAALLLAATAAACTPPIKDPGIMAGNWTMRTPEGRSVPVTVTEFREYEYHLRANNMPFNGVYAYNDGDLVCVKPDNPRMGAYGFSKKSEKEIILSNEPPFEHTQLRLISATMTLNP